MNIQNLRQKSNQKPIEFIDIKVKIPSDQYQLIIDNHIDPTVVVAEAFREVAAALDKDNILRSVTTPIVHEVIKKERRGDFDGTSVAERILAEFPKYDGALSAAEISEFLGINITYSNSVLIELFGQGKVLRSGTGVRGDPYKYRLPEAPTEFDKMFPKGTKVEVLG